MLNSVIVQGKVINDVKVKDIEDGRSMALFTIAHSRDRITGKEERGIDNIDVVAWGDLAHFISNNYRKGDEIIIQGKIQVRMFKKDESNRVKSTEIVAEHAYFGRVGNVYKDDPKQ